jgi:hypothetical protein
LTDDSDEDQFLNLKALEKSKPAVLRMKKAIYVSRNPCFDCKAFQRRACQATDIDVNIIVNSSTTSSVGSIPYYLIT